MENLNFDNDVDSTSDSGSNEDVDNIITNKNLKRANKSTSTKNVASKVPRINVASLLIHRVICVYFMVSLKKKQYKPSLFLKNNPEITPWALAKFVKSGPVIEELNNLRDLYGNDFLDQDKSVVWVTDKKLISLSLIPNEVLRKYSDEPNRFRGPRTFKTPKEAVQKFLPITSTVGVSSLFTTKKHLPINSQLATLQQIHTKSETITSDSDAYWCNDSSGDQQFNDNLSQSIVYVDDDPAEKVIMCSILFNISYLVHLIKYLSL